MATKIELLSPAKNAEYGMAAINCGADAVYIGAPRFGARASAGNSISEIEKLCQYAHLFHAKVHVALNTILTDNELESARKIIFQLYSAGADALIFQDTGILQLDLPPIALHASTQCDNRTPEKVRFWESIGLQRVILARELSLEQIREIRKNTTIELESFVHGALCVSYSGQCYMSQACTGRSANRGECAQFCRLPYSLQDADGQTLRKNSHLLSLKDMDRSASLKELMDAGICSFKIEGRLKGIDYVKNITAFYRQKLDAILEEKQTASSGKVKLLFTPDTRKTFNRGKTEYFLHRRDEVLVNPDTPKSIGEPLGKLLSINGNTLRIDTSAELHNGDGLGFVDKEGELRGFRINKVENQKITTLETIRELADGTMIYRNSDILFDKQLAGDAAIRKISVDILFEETKEGFSLTLTDEDGIRVSRDFKVQKEISQKGEIANELLLKNLAKMGNTPFSTKKIDIKTDGYFFFPVSIINEWRRILCNSLIEKRLQYYQRPQGTLVLHNDVPFPSAEKGRLTYAGNVMNEKAAEFYREHGITEIAPAFEMKKTTDAALMTCKHCIKFALGACSKETKKSGIALHEPLYLKTGKFTFRLEFDCKNCEMKVMSSE